MSLVERIAWETCVCVRATAVEGTVWLLSHSRPGTEWTGWWWGTAVVQGWGVRSRSFADQSLVRGQKGAPSKHNFQSLGAKVWDDFCVALGCQENVLYVTKNIGQNRCDIPSVELTTALTSSECAHIPPTCPVKGMPLPPPQDPVCPGRRATFVTCVVGGGANVILVGGSKINAAFMEVFKNLVGEREVTNHLNSLHS